MGAGLSDIEGADRLQVRVLGPVRASVDGIEVNLGGPRQRAVLALLACHAPRVVPVSTIIDSVWGEDPPDSANAVQVCINRLRHSLGSLGSALQTDPPGYRLAIDEEGVDARYFTALLDRARSGNGQKRALLERALQLWSGEPFADLGEVPFVTGESTRLREVKLAAVEERIELDLANGQHVDLVPELEALVEADPYREGLWRSLIVALYRSGRQADALGAFQRVRKVLLEDLGLDPGPALVALEEAVLRQDPLLDPPVSPTPETRLKQPATELIGRRDELPALEQAVRSHRLVTVLGPGGVGKTRLALEAAHGLVEAFPGGVSFVELADVRDPGLVMPEIGRALGAQGGIDATQAVVDHLDDAAALLVLDNLEQIPDVADDLADLLESSAATHLLITSRVPLHIRAEQLFPLSPLPLADAAGLFAARAQAVKPGFDDQQAALDIANRLEGLPLAIELAAAKCRVLSADELLRRLSKRFEALSHGPRDVPVRHRTLRATLVWSTDLLDPNAQDVFARLAVFSSPFSLDAANAVGGNGADILEPLSSLVDANLVSFEVGRYRMLETVREFGWELLDGSGLVDEMETRRAEWALEFCRSALTRLHSDQEVSARAELAAMLPDLRATIETFLKSERHENAAEVLLSTTLMWFNEGLLPEFARHLEAVATGSLTDLTAAEVTVTRGVFAKIAGDIERGVRLMQEGTGRLRQLSPNAVALVNGLCHLAAIHAERDEAEVAFELADEAIFVAERCDDPGSLVMAHDLAGYVARVLGDSQRAVRAEEFSVATGRASASPQLANALAGLAVALDAVGRNDEAVAAAREGLERAEAVGSPAQLAEVTSIVATVLGKVEPTVIAKQLVKAIADWVAMGAIPSALDAAESLADVTAEKLPEQAAELVGAVENYTGSTAEPKLTSDLVNRLGVEVYEQHHRAGAQLSVDGLSRLAAEMAAVLVGPS
jgi:predicted ATPase/DNA-binding SARP family transcriptional activator